MVTLALSFHSLELKGACSIESTVNVHLMKDGKNALLFDTGYNETESLRALTEWIGTQQVTVRGILVTHAHPDHAGGLLALAERFLCNVYIHPLERQYLEKKCGLLRERFAAISWKNVAEGDTIHLCEHHIETVETPGHTHGHLAWYEPTTKTLVAGDNATSAGTVWIGPPDGHLADFYESLTRLDTLHAKVILPGHGKPILEAPSFFMTMLKRREARSAQILHHLNCKAQSAQELTDVLYGASLPSQHMWVALATVRAHLSHLLEQSRVVCTYDTKKKTLMYRAVSEESLQNEESHRDSPPAPA